MSGEIGEPDWADEEAAALLVQLGAKAPYDAVKLIAAKLRLAKQEGVCDGLAKAQDALKEAFKK